MLRLQFNTAFTYDSVMMLSRGDLDDIESDHFHDRFLVTINSEEVGEPHVTISPWAKHKPVSSSVLFSSQQEIEELTESFVPKTKPPGQRPPPPRPVPPKAAPSKPPPPSQVHKDKHAVTDDLLNLGSNSEATNGMSHSSKPSSAIETDDLLNLSFDAGPPPVQPDKTPDPNLAYPTATDMFFTEAPAPDKASNITGNLLGDWEADFAGPNVTANIQNLNIGAGVGLNPTPSPSGQTPPIPGAPTQQSSQLLGGFPAAGNIQRNVSSPNLHSDLFEELITKPKAVSNANSPSKTLSEANYSRSHFESAKPQPPVNPSKKMEDAFGDLLGSQGYTFTAKKDTGPKTINEMRREDQVKVTDPDKLKVMDWTEGKKSNIRALLTSLHTILWPDAKWSQCYMHQLVNPADVKKAYRKACIAVHPDKHMGTPNEKLAKMIFMELNNAWNDFEKELG